MKYPLAPKHVLVFYGDTNEFDKADWISVLTEKEINRAGQYHLEQDKHRYIFSRAVLKRLLSRYLQIDTGKIEFSYGKNGKPFLPGNPGMHFNISHSGEAIVIGIAMDNEIGIDVESLKRKVNISKLQNYLFTPAELKQFNTIHQNNRHEVFINCWTIKEAFLKATGDGLTHPMNSLEISWIKNMLSTSETSYRYNGNRIDWFFENYTLLDHYRGTVAVKGKVKNVQYISINKSKWLLKNAS